MAQTRPAFQRPDTEIRLRMSYEEFLEWADEDVHAEWVNGEVIVFMPPKNRHQEIVTFLATLMRLYADFFNLGKVLVAPFEMRLTNSAREPDILFVARESLPRLTQERLQGPADLVVEVVSEYSVGRDRVEKLLEYQTEGVREYWLIDSRPGKAGAEFFVRDAQGKFNPVPADEGGVYRSTVLAGFWWRLDWLYADEFPDTLLTFAEIAGFPAEVVETLRQMGGRERATD
ncbi:MAG: Uma2 family endonuclease [Fimbriimonadales bacterium]|nr:MAG: hypothetical protein KatS3mg018_0522 [Fimbriimonadales bacterium]